MVRAALGTMITVLKKMLAKLDVPADDWVLSRYGGCEAPNGANEVDAPVSGVRPLQVRDEPVDEAPLSDGASVLSQSDEPVSPTAPVEDYDPKRKSNFV